MATNKDYKDNLTFLEKSTPTRRYIPLNDFSSISDTGVTQVNTPALPLTISLTIGTDVFGKPLDSPEVISFTMLLNPSFKNVGRTFSSSPIAALGGFVVQLWGPNQEIITSNGRTAVCMRQDYGISALDRPSSFAFQNLNALVNAYRNNGYQIISQGSSAIRTLKTYINLIHGVEISYDGDIFMGHFNNFTLDEDDSSPFTFTYNFEFVISNYMNDTNRISGHYFSKQASGANKAIVNSLQQNIQPIAQQKKSKTKKTNKANAAGTAGTVTGFPGTTQAPLNQGQGPTVAAAMSAAVVQSPYLPNSLTTLNTLMDPGYTSTAQGREAINNIGAVTPQTILSGKADPSAGSQRVQAEIQSPIKG